MKKNNICLLIDLEGTIYFKNKLISGAKEAITSIREQGYLLRFLSNTDSITEKQLADKINKYGILISNDEIFTPITALRRFKSQHNDKLFYYFLSSNLLEVVSQDNIDNNKFDYVVIGDNRDKITYESLNLVFQYIMDGADIIALQAGRFFTRDDGFSLDTGSFISMFEYASNKRALILGKPSASFFQLALDSVMALNSHTIIIGDDILTDITGAKNVGCRSVLLKTGKYAYNITEDYGYKPDYILDSIAELPLFLENINDW